MRNLCLWAVLLLASAACAPRPSTDSPDTLATLAALSTENARQATQISEQATLISHLATRGPSTIRPDLTAFPTPYRPVIGSVQIEDGRCCIGGIAGETVQIQVLFEAGSPFGAVSQMRTMAGGLRATEEQLAGVEWVPFAGRAIYNLNVALNWHGFSVSVQFRDEEGNLSPVYHDDIAVEGRPAQDAP